MQSGLTVLSLSYARFDAHDAPVCVGFMPTGEVATATEAKGGSVDSRSAAGLTWPDPHHERSEERK